MSNQVHAGVLQLINSVATNRVGQTFYYYNLNCIMYVKSTVFLVHACMLEFNCLTKKTAFYTRWETCKAFFSGPPSTTESKCKQKT